MERYVKDWLNLVAIAARSVADNGACCADPCDFENTLCAACRAHPAFRRLPVAASGERRAR